MTFKVSVIIPVYNCENYIEKAITSALLQPEVFEIIVVNDGSTDGTENSLQNLQKAYPKVKVFHHQNKVNKGRSASRNLGIQKATGNFIAFLDADDFYLENRFKNDQFIFENNPEADGVYNAIGAHFYREASTEEKNQLNLYSLSEAIEPKHLFQVLFFGKKGHFSIDGLTLKKAVFTTVGYFNEKLKVSEDTELFFKLALKHHLVAGNLKSPVAVRGVHDTNIFNKTTLYKNSEITLYESLFLWSCKHHIPLRFLDITLNRLWLLRYKKEKNIVSHTTYWWFLFSKSPKHFATILSIKYFPVIRQRQKLFPFLFNK